MSKHESHDHDRGLQYDVEIMASRIKERRAALAWVLSGGAAALIASCGGGDGEEGFGTGLSSASSRNSSSRATASGTCIANPEETQGPYPADGSSRMGDTAVNVLNKSGVVRSDIRSSFGSSTNIAAGVPLSLTLKVVSSNSGCAALSGYAVYIWHCDRDGNYSLYSNGVQEENYLRGVQVTDSKGQVTFQSVFPACYFGRYPHIHFEVYSSLAAATLYKNRVLTSQMVLPRDICNTVFSSATGYSQSAANLSRTTIANDNVFADNSTAQINQMTVSLSGSVSAGYTGTLLIGVPA